MVGLKTTSKHGKHCWKSSQSGQFFLFFCLYGGGQGAQTTTFFGCKKRNREEATAQWQTDLHDDVGASLQ